MKKITKNNEKVVHPWDVGSCAISASKHFLLKYMRKWNWDYYLLRQCLQDASIERCGKEKYEAYVRRKGAKKIILVYDEATKEIFVISGSEGK